MNNLPPTTSSFYSYFQKETTQLEHDIARISTDPAAADALLATLSRLAGEVRDATSQGILPSYDQRRYSETLKDLTERVQQARTQTAPKKKFAFSARRTAGRGAVQTAVTGLDGTHSQESKAPNVGPLAPVDSGAPPSRLAKASESAPAGSTLSHKEDAYLILSPEGEAARSVSVTDIKGSVVVLGSPKSSPSGVTDTTPPLSSISVRSVERSLIVCILPVAGSVHATSLRGVTLFLVHSAHQLRMHDCVDVHVVLGGEQNASIVIEACKGMKFGRNAREGRIRADDYASFVASLKVDDFSYPLPGPNPNWSILPSDGVDVTGVVDDVGRATSNEVVKELVKRYCPAESV